MSPALTLGVIGLSSILTGAMVVLVGVAGVRVGRPLGRILRAWWIDNSGRHGK